MRLPAVPVHSFEDATLDMEAIQGALTTPGSSLPFLQILSAGQLQLAHGSNSVTFSASTNSATTTISHGLGRTPAWVGATASSNSGVWFVVQSKNSTQFGIVGWFFSAATGTFNFDWVAIG